MPSQPPDNYERQFDFTDFSQNQPSVQQPGQQIDLELNEAAASINQTISRLNEIQRDDGKLRAEAWPGNDIQESINIATAMKNEAVQANADAQAAKQYVEQTADTLNESVSEAAESALYYSQLSQNYSNNSASSAQSAGSSASLAQAAAASAAEQALLAEASAQAAGDSELAAANSAIAAQAAVDSFNPGSYIPQPAVAPVDGQILGYDGVAWVAQDNGAVRWDVSQTIDPMDQAQARGNIGLGTAATENTSAFAAAVHTHVHGDVTDLPQGVAYALGIGGGSAANGSSALSGTPGTDKVVGFNGLYAAWVPAGDRYATSSTTSLSVGTGSRTLTVGTGLAYTSQQSVTIAYDASNHMHGEVTSYDSATGVLVVDVKQKTGSGTYAAWSVNVGGISSIATWGQITGTLSSQTDLQSALDGKAASSHTHTASAITDFNTAADARVNALVPAASTTVAGKVELATATEAIAATSTTLAVTPDDLYWNRVTPGMGLLLGTNSNGITSGTGALSNASMFGITCLGPDAGVVGYAGRRFQMNNGQVGSLERDWGVVDFDRRISLSFRIAPVIVTSGSPNNDSVINVNYGDLLGTDTGGTLARKGFGIQIYGHNNPLRLTVHDGTTYRTVNSSYTPTSSTTPVSMDFLLVSEAGTVTLYQRTTRTGGWSQIATSANGPTGLSASTACSVTCTARNESINVTTVRWRCLAGFFTVEY